jgi:hypothetical protein
MCEGVPDMRKISPLLVMPALVIVLYVPLYLTGARNFGQAEGLVPVLVAAHAVLFVICVVGYGGAGIGPALLGGAALLAAVSVLMLARFFIGRAVLADVPTGWPINALLLLLVFSALFITATMAIAAKLCPPLRRQRLWTITLIAYPMFATATYSATPRLTLRFSDLSSLPAALFAVYIINQVVIFACLGVWVSEPALDAPGDAR